MGRQIQPRCPHRDRIASGDTYNGRQIVICRAEEDISLNLNICTDGNNCTQLLVELQSCPLTSSPGADVTDTSAGSLPTDIL